MLRAGAAGPCEHSYPATFSAVRIEEMTMTCPHQHYQSRGTVRLTHEMVRYLIRVQFGAVNIVHLAALLDYGWPVRGGEA